MQRNSKSADAQAKRGPIVLVGMMGVGKSTVGRRLAARLGLGLSMPTRRSKKRRA